ncbi:DUF6177 family protein [Streptomyces sp. NPDC007264]|uniref:DUF6177 family protein n=1 Tax=Streptomyces sp. NPDC007264 TaxID=3364777 RepID=UPI0036DE257A
MAICGAGPRRAPARRPHPGRLGPPTRPTLHYLLGDGTDPEAWSTFQQLARAPEAGSGRRQCHPAARPRVTRRR